uniref:PHD-type domain-containing protein n=1 Tax=Steinernema glaseri TaxID=37863 RepID=A0A1I7Z6W0_9BILA
MAPAPDEEVYCICRKPDDGNKMVACDKCEEWFHADCVGFTEEMDAEEKPYFCKACSTRRKKSIVKRRATTPIKTPGKKPQRGVGLASDRHARKREEGTTREGAGPGSSGELSASLSRLTDINQAMFSRLAVLEFARMVEDDAFLSILQSA